MLVDVTIRIGIQRIYSSSIANDDCRGFALSQHSPGLMTHVCKQESVPHGWLVCAGLLVSHKEAGIGTGAGVGAGTNWFGAGVSIGRGFSSMYLHAQEVSPVVSISFSHASLRSAGSTLSQLVSLQSGTIGPVSSSPSQGNAFPFPHCELASHTPEGSVRMLEATGTCQSNASAVELSRVPL